MGSMWTPPRILRRKSKAKRRPCVCFRSPGKGAGTGALRRMLCGGCFPADVFRESVCRAEYRSRKPGAGSTVVSRARLHFGRQSIFRAALWPMAFFQGCVSAFGTFSGQRFGRGVFQAGLRRRPGKRLRERRPVCRSVCGSSVRTVKPRISCRFFLQRIPMYGILKDGLFWLALRPASARGAVGYEDAARMSPVEKDTGVCRWAGARRTSKRDGKDQKRYE